MIVSNTTHYFSEYTRTYNSVPDPNSFSFESSKRMGYFQRLWFEYAYTRKVRGICFYYTLTYNDKSIPKFRGRNCFSYEHIRYITNGKLSKILLRKYGSRLRYFCACESGEGKGLRGLGNNPHYHFIFFVQPIHDKNDQPVYDNYKCISPQEFKDLIYELWQGLTSDRFVLWQYAKFGHCQEGKYNGEVLSFEAFKYVGKYCVKDLNEKYYEESLKKDYAKELRTCGINFQVLYEYYRFLLLTDMSCTSKYDFFEYFQLLQYNHWRKSVSGDTSLSRFYKCCSNYAAQTAFSLCEQWFNNYYVPQSVESLLSEYRNLYSGKCRMSKTLGIYGLNFVTFSNGSPRLVLNTKKGYEVQFPCLFYIRKLFYDVKICPYTGNPLYYLNEKGIEMKLASMPSLIDSFFNKTVCNISQKQLSNIPVSLKDSFNETGYILDSQLSHRKVVFSESDSSVFDEFISLNDRLDIVYRYAVYHCIYQYRSFDKYTYLTADCKEKDYLLDYSLFLHQNSYYLDYESGTIFDMISKFKVYCSFSLHPAFRPYMKYFEYLDKLNEVVDKFNSDSNKQKFAEKSKHQQRLNSYRFNASFDSIPIDIDSFDSSLFDSFVSNV